MEFVVHQIEGDQVRIIKGYECVLHVNQVCHAQFIYGRHRQVWSYMEIHQKLRRLKLFLCVFCTSQISIKLYIRTEKKQTVGYIKSRALPLQTSVISHSTIHLFFSHTHNVFETLVICMHNLHLVRFTRIINNPAAPNDVTVACSLISHWLHSLACMFVGRWEQADL